MPSTRLARPDCRKFVFVTENKKLVVSLKSLQGGKLPGLKRHRPLQFRCSCPLRACRDLEGTKSRISASCEPRVAAWCNPQHRPKVSKSPQTARVVAKQDGPLVGAVIDTTLIPIDTSSLSPSMMVAVGCFHKACSSFLHHKGKICSHTWKLHAVLFIIKAVAPTLSTGHPH